MCSSRNILCFNQYRKQVEMKQPLKQTFTLVKSVQKIKQTVKQAVKQTFTLLQSVQTMKQTLTLLQSAETTSKNEADVCSVTISGNNNFVFHTNEK